AVDSSSNPDDQDWQPQAQDQSPHRSKGKAGPDQTAKPGRASDRKQSSNPTMYPAPGGPTGDDQHARDQSGQGSQPGGMNRPSNDPRARDSHTGKPDQSGQSGQTGETGRAGQSGRSNQSQIPGQTAPQTN